MDFGLLNHNNGSDFEALVGPKTEKDFWVLKIHILANRAWKKFF